MEGVFSHVLDDALSTSGNQEIHHYALLVDNFLENSTNSCGRVRYVVHI
jgi:hypothetical protein